MKEPAFEILGTSWFFDSLIFFQKYPEPAVLWKIKELHNTAIYVT
jgi:hypothetical protein